MYKFLWNVYFSWLVLLAYVSSTGGDKVNEFGFETELGNLYVWYTLMPSFQPLTLLWWISFANNRNVLQFTVALFS
jgi:hypothetical protein